MTLWFRKRLEVFRELPVLLVLLAVLLTVFLSLQGVALYLTRTGVGQPPALTLPALSLRTLAGERVALAQPAGQPTIVHLWSKDCGRCASELGLLERAARSARYGGFRYLFVNQGDSAAEVADYARRHGLPRARVFLDPDLKLTNALAAHSLPASYFFRADGRLEEARGTVLRPDFLASTLERLTAR